MKLRSLRSDESNQAYVHRRQHDKVWRTKGFIDFTKLPTIREWEHWFMAENEFPYDRVADKHDMLITKRVIVNEKELALEEAEELIDILYELNEEYNFIMRSLPHQMSVPMHLHYNLIHLKEFDFTDPEKPANNWTRPFNLVKSLLPGRK